MGKESDLRGYCCEIEEIKVKEEPIEYDLNIDDKKIMLDAVQSGNEKLELDEKVYIYKHESLEIGDHMISCKVEPEDKSCDPLYLNQNIENESTNVDFIYNCPKCTYTSNSRHNYKRHVQRHDNIKKFACTVCNKRFYEKRKLRLHEFIHSGRKMFECTLCDYGAIRKDHFTRHVQNKHAKTNDKQYKCPKCEYQTNDKYDMRKHDFVHEEARPHVCEICSRQFKRVCELKIHGVVHDGEKRYQCAHCDFKTNMKTQLARHLKRKHVRERDKEYECSKCTYKTAYHSDLNTHFKRHLRNGEIKRQTVLNTRDMLIKQNTTLV